MNAVRIKAPGKFEVFDLVQVPEPLPNYNEIKVCICAPGLNRADLFQRDKGGVPPGILETIPGIEFAGEIVKLGDSVKRWSKGDRVFGICSGGLTLNLLLCT